MMRQKAREEFAYRFAANLMQFLVIPTFVVDAEGQVMIWNRACELLTGIPAKEMLGTRRHWQAFYAEERACLCDLIRLGRLDQIERLYVPGMDVADMRFGVHVENWCTMPRLGVERYLSIDAGPLYDEQGHLIAVVETLSDMTNLRRTQDELEKLVMRDPLTQVLNRRGFDDRLGAEVDRAMHGQYPLAVLMIDVDRFKQFNDEHGHPAGDECLQRVAERIAACVARPGDIVARYGGEEFCAVLAGADPAGARVVAQRVCAAVAAEPVTVDGRPVAVTVSVGAAAFVPQHPTDAFSLVALADRALYQAKQEGRNRVVCAAGR